MAVRKLTSSDSRKADSGKNHRHPSIAMRDDPSRVDPKKLKLGKQIARHDPRTLLLASYITPALPAPPATFDLTQKVGAAYFA